MTYHDVIRDDIRWEEKKRSEIRREKKRKEEEGWRDEST